LDLLPSRVRRSICLFEGYPWSEVLPAQSVRYARAGGRKTQDTDR
jgi:hypothetical protein